MQDVLELHKIQIINYGGTDGVRSMPLLESAIVEGVNMSIAKKLMDSLTKNLKQSHTKVSDSYLYLVLLFPLQVISTKVQHASALEVIEKLILFINVRNIEDDGIKVYLRTLSELVGDYEKKNYTTSATSGKDMLAYLKELQGLNQKDLAKELGGQPIVSKILKGERELNLRQIKALAKTT